MWLLQQLAGSSGMFKKNFPNSMTTQLKAINVKAYQFKHTVMGDQITRQKLQMSILLLFELVLHVTWSSAFIDAE
jgi:hypothetical protein